MPHLEDKHEHEPSKERSSPAQFVPPRKERCRPGRSDQARNACQEEDLRFGSAGDGSQSWATLLGGGLARRKDGRTFPSASRAPSNKRTTPKTCSQRRKAS